VRLRAGEPGQRGVRQGSSSFLVLFSELFMLPFPFHGIVLLILVVYVPVRL
jgi:hypothetical protein